MSGLRPGIFFRTRGFLCSHFCIIAEFLVGQLRDYKGILPLYRHINACNFYFAITWTQKLLRRANKPFRTDRMRLEVCLEFVFLGVTCSKMLLGKYIL